MGLSEVRKSSLWLIILPLAIGCSTPPSPRSLQGDWRAGASEGAPYLRLAGNGSFSMSLGASSSFAALVGRYEVYGDKLVLHVRMNERAANLVLLVRRIGVDKIAIKLPQEKGNETIFTRGGN